MCDALRIHKGIQLCIDERASYECFYRVRAVGKHMTVPLAPQVTLDFAWWLILKADE